MSLNAEKLWDTVCAYFRQQSLESNHSNWRQSETHKAECQYCVVTGGGPLIKCSVDRCKREYHIECGSKSGAFFLEEDNTLTFLCEVHHKPILFCTCMQPYDVNKSAEMVCCDECIEWFHNSCVGLSHKEAASLEKYICPRCDKLHQEGKMVSAQEKDRNLEKETRSSHQQEAMRPLRVLVEISECVVPLIDQLDITGSTLTNSLDKVDYADLYDFSQMKDAATYLSSNFFINALKLSSTNSTTSSTNIISSKNKKQKTEHPTAPNLSSSEIADEDTSTQDNTNMEIETAESKPSALTIATTTSNNDIVLNFFGTEDLLRTWHYKLKQFTQDYNTWSAKIKKLIKEYKNKLMPSWSLLDQTTKEVLSEFLQFLQDLQIETNSSMALIKETYICLQFFNAYIEAVTLINEFIDVSKEVVLFVGRYISFSVCVYLFITVSIV